MASCLVPEVAAVPVALERLKALERRLAEEGAPPAASLHLAEVAAAVTDLESERRAAHERLEVETIENSKLRHNIGKMRERMKREIAADVAAARASNAKEMEQLQKEIKTVCELQDDTGRRREALLSQNKALGPHREQVQREHEEAIAALNDQITLKYSLQTELDQTREEIEKLKSCIAAVEQDRITLGQKSVLERRAFTEKKDSLSGEVDQTDGKIKQQKQAIGMIKEELSKVNSRKQEREACLEELVTDMAKLESNSQSLTASRCQYEKQLRGESQKHQDMRDQADAQSKELSELEEAFSVTIQRLKGGIATVEGKIEESRALGLLCQGRLAQICEMFKHQYDNEMEVSAEHFHVSQQLERSKLQLEERIASIVKHKKAIKEMEQQTRELQETDTINQRVFLSNQEELFGNMDTEKKNIGHLEAEKCRLIRLLEEEKEKQEEHVAKMTSDIGETRRRFEELRLEEAALHQRQPKSTDADLLISHMTQCEVEYRKIEIKYNQEIEQCIAETEKVTKSAAEKQRDVEEKEKVLREVEARWNEEQSRHQRLKMLTSDLGSRRTELERSICGLKEKTSSLLQPKEEMKAELDEARANHMKVLKELGSELRAVEMSISDNSLKLDQVGMENSRLRLRVTQMTEDMSRARRDRDRYQQDTHQFQQNIKALFDSLQEAWREDLLVTEEGQKSGGVLLNSMSALLNRLKSRKQQLEHVNKLLHQQMLDFSKRLGDKAVVDPRSLIDKHD